MAVALDVLHALRPRAGAVSDLDLLIRGDERDVAVADGRIVAVGPELERPGARGGRRARAARPARRGRRPRPPQRARAHRLGGLRHRAPPRWRPAATTCAIDMPLNAVPPTIDGAAFDAKVAAATGVARVDFALWGGLVPGDLDRLDELAARGVVGFKAFMSASGVEEFEAADDLTLLEGMARAARLGPARRRARRERGAHAPARRAARSPRAGTACATTWPRAPSLAELEAIARAIAFAAETGCALHVVHVSSGRGVALVAQARARGVDVTCETCPHYLVLDARGRRAPGRGGQVRAAAARRRRARGAVGGAARRRRRPGGLRPLARAARR